jgi:multidrug resistance efflux pump
MTAKMEYNDLARLQDDYNRARKLWDRCLISDEAYDRARDALKEATRHNQESLRQSTPWNDPLGC